MGKGGLTPTRRAGMGLMTIEGVGYDYRDPIKFYAGGRAGRKLGQADVMLENLQRASAASGGGVAPPAEAPAPQTVLGLTLLQWALIGGLVYLVWSDG